MARSKRNPQQALRIVRETTVRRSPRVRQMEGIFDVPAAQKNRLEWNVNLPLAERDWRIGLIVGPSGCGKTTIARELFGESLVSGYDWDPKDSILDGFPGALGIKDVTGLLSSVGFSSPPAWVRPFHCLSNGEQFRVTLARALADARPLVAIDEFTSVVDRTVARIGANAVAKTVRRGDEKRFVAVSCHADIVEWLDPDWIYEPALDRFQWRRERPGWQIELAVYRHHRCVWPLFRPHHYLSGDLNKSSRCYVATVRLSPAEDALPCGFCALLPIIGRKKMWRGHRTVVLPDFQGAGIGNRLVELIAETLWRTEGITYSATTSSPAINAHRRRHPHMWRMTRKPSMNPKAGPNGRFKEWELRKGKQPFEVTPAVTSFGRITTAWRYIPEEKRCPN